MLRICPAGKYRKGEQTGMRNMTEGSIAGNLIAFSVPLVLGNLFQLTYNAVDSMIVGRFAGDTAQAAVGTADPVMNLLILFITGLCIGASVLMSSFFGAGRLDMLRREMATLLLLGMGLSAILSAGGFCLAGVIFRSMDVPEEAMGPALAYLRIILAGMPFTCLYNIYAQSLRSVGDSKTAVWILAGACAANGLMDLLFVAVFRWGTSGAALATVIANFLSAAGCILYTWRRVEVLQVRRADFRPDPELLKNTVRYGSTTALQQISQPLGKLLIQGMVNSMGVSTMAAFNAVGKIEDFALVPERSISSAMMTCTAQNLGAGEKKRVRRGLRQGMLLELGYFIFICAAILLFHRPVLSLFSTEEMTLREGARYFQVMAFFYWMPGLTNGIQGFFRGMKHMRITLVLTIVQISVRVLVTRLLIGSLGIEGIAFACAAGWAAMLVAAAAYCRTAVWPSLADS